MTTEHKPHSSAKWDGDDPRMEAIFRAANMGVSLGLYDEVLKPAEQAVGSLIFEHNGLLEQLEAQDDLLRDARSLIGYADGGDEFSLACRAWLKRFHAASNPASEPHYDPLADDRAHYAVDGKYDPPSPAKGSA